ncbi:restriction endonuclease subunit S [Cetobacterium sp.]|uniref:restriction endonuclease subunit S n=1 Tax=Cetobacterium sp. TaxID=2071632 RepID=UPI003EE70FA7
MNKKINKLNDKEWKEFKIYDLFSHQRGKRQVESNRKKGNIPYFSASQNNNGLTDFISNPIFQIDRNAIIYSTFGDSYYVEKMFSTSDEITILTKENLNKYNGLFLSNSINQNKSKYSFGRKAFSNKISKDKIMLPINKNSEPDYKYMEQYTKSITETKLEKYKCYVKKQLEKIEYKKIEKLENKKWKEFKIRAISNIHSGIDIYERERIKGDIPYISSTSKNNGIGYFIDNKNKTLDQNCLSINRNGSVGYSFFHPYKALFSNDCRKLKLNHNSKFVGIFISNQITMQKEKYNYGYKMGTDRLKKQVIMLPVNESLEPDYEYMEQYIKNIIYKKLNSYLNYKKTLFK